MCEQAGSLPEDLCSDCDELALALLVPGASAADAGPVGARPDQRPRQKSEPGSRRRSDNQAAAAGSPGYGAAPPPPRPTL